MIVQNIAKDDTTDFTFTVHRNDYHKASNTKNSGGIGCAEVIGTKNIVKLSWSVCGHAFMPESPVPCLRRWQ